MPTANVNGLDLYYEEAGAGPPVVFLHEFCSDLRMWDQVMGPLSRHYRCIRYNFRGYPPSGTPSDALAYSSDLLVSDLEGLLVALGIPSAHIVGVATGGGIALNLAIRRPDLVQGLAVIGPGAGGTDREAWLSNSAKLVDAITTEGITALVQNMEAAPQRRPLKMKDPVAWSKFVRELNGLSAVGLSLTMANVLMKRLPLQELANELRSTAAPTLIVVGDQDSPAFETCLFLRQTMPYAALSVLPFTGHMVPVEEPNCLRALLLDFLDSVSAGQWAYWRRDRESRPQRDTTHTEA